MIESNDNNILVDSEHEKPVAKKKGMSTKTISSSNKMIGSSNNLSSNLATSFRSKESFDLSEHVSSSGTVVDSNLIIPSRPPMVQQTSTESNSEVIHPLHSIDLDFISNQNTFNENIVPTQPDLLDFNPIEIVESQTQRDIFSLSPSNPHMNNFDTSPTPISSTSFPTVISDDLFNFPPPDGQFDINSRSEAVLISSEDVISPLTEIYSPITQTFRSQVNNIKSNDSQNYIEEPSYDSQQNYENGEVGREAENNENIFYQKYPMYHPDDVSSQLIGADYEYSLNPVTQIPSSQDYESTYYQEQPYINYDSVYSKNPSSDNVINSDYYHQENDQEYTQEYYQNYPQQYTNSNYPEYSPKTFEANPYYTEYSSNELFENNNEADQSFYYQNDNNISDPNQLDYDENMQYTNQEGYYDNPYPYDLYPQDSYPQKSYDYSNQQNSTYYDEYHQSYQVQDLHTISSQQAKKPEFDIISNIPEVQYNDDSSIDNSESNQNDIKSKIIGMLSHRAGSDQALARHLQVWERFIENASQFAQEKKSSFSTLSSVTSKPELTIVEDKINFTSGLSLKFFVYTIDGQYSWPLLISSRRYLSLLALAKAGGESADPILIHLALFAAVINEDANNVQYFLLKGGNANTVDEKGRALAHHAARTGNAEILALLLDNNCDLDKLDDDKLAAIHIAIAYNKLRAIQFLVDSAVNVNIKTSNELTLIGYAKKIQAIESEKLLSHLINMPSESDDEGFSPQPKLVKPPPVVTLNLKSNDIAPPNKSHERHQSSHVTFQTLDFEKPITSENIKEEPTTPPPNESIRNSIISKKNLYSIYMDKVADDCWDFLMSLYTLSFSMILSNYLLFNFIYLFNSPSKDKNQTNETNPSTQEEPWSQRSAPPTDSELKQQGLGYTNRSPTSKLQPPKDVQVAIAMSKAGIPLPSINSPVVNEFQKSPSNGTKSPANKNNYSIGKNLPNGVSWRYVNILEDKVSETSSSV